VTGPEDVKGKLARLKLLVMDVDGVLTEGKIYMTERGEEMKVFHCRDGAGIVFLHAAGVQTALVSARACPAVRKRAAELGIRHVHLGAADKKEAVRRILSAAGAEPEEAAYIGDDIPDLLPAASCGMLIAPCDAAAEVRARADVVLSKPGGAGAVREAAELILKASGEWDSLVQRSTG